MYEAAEAIIHLARTEGKLYKDQQKRDIMDLADEGKAGSDQAGNRRAGLVRQLAGMVGVDRDPYCFAREPNAAPVPERPSASLQKLAYSAKSINLDGRFHWATISNT